MRPTSVAAILFNSLGQVLILRRGPTAPWMPGGWNLPGGSLDPGESWFEGAARETEEETQLVVQRAQYLVTLGDPVEGWAVAFFVAKSGDWSGRLTLNYESDAYAWVTPDELEDYTFVPTVKEALSQAFSQQSARSNSRGPQDLVAAAQGFAGQYLNCRLFVQQLLGIPRLEDLSVVKTKQVGDVLQWGKNPARHWAVYIGNGDVLEVAEWGAQPQITPLVAVVAEYGKPSAIRRMERCNSGVPAKQCKRRGGGMATVLRETVYHIGRLQLDSFGRIEPRRGQVPFSLEGLGLSVSEYPAAWRRIARLGGRPWYQLQRIDGAAGCFVDLSEGIPKKIREEAIRQGYLQRKVQYRVAVYDEEGDLIGFHLFSTNDEAYEEYDPEDVSKTIGYAPTAKLHQAYAVGFSKPVPLATAEDLAALLILEQQHTELDGAWWFDLLCPEQLSAPRGVIFPSKLHEWCAVEISPFSDDE